MGADQIAAIRPALVEVSEGAEAGESWCATFTVSGDRDRWIQVTTDAVNMAYPHQEEPTRRLAAAGAEMGHLQCKEWEAGRFATFRIDGALPAGRLARLIDLLFVTVLGCGADYPVDVEMATIREP